MKYRVISTDNKADFIDLVNEAIAEGWQPHGGVSVVRYEASYMFDNDVCWLWAQAMTKADDIEKQSTTTNQKGQTE